MVLHRCLSGTGPKAKQVRESLRQMYQAGRGTVGPGASPYCRMPPPPTGARGKKCTKHICEGVKESGCIAKEVQQYPCLHTESLV